MSTNPRRDEDPGRATARREIVEARAGVVRALARVERGERNALEELRGVLCTFVRALRDDGASREDAIEAVRVVVSTPATQDAGPELRQPAREALVELSTHWCAAEYEGR
jgi:hypothetical protein